MKLLLIRHPDPDYANDTITAVGHEQTRLLGKAMVPLRIDEIVASSYGRAITTAHYSPEAAEFRGDHDAPG